MSNLLKPDLCVIGSGAAGLSVAAGAARFGLKVVLIEKHIRRDAQGEGIMGGDCLHTGCVPSKALLAAGHHAAMMGEGEPFGVAAAPADVDFARVHRHVHDVIAAIAPIDSVTRFEGLGVKVIEGAARFTDRGTVMVNGQSIRARRFVIATGSTAAVPPIPGLDGLPYFTNETLFDNTGHMPHLIIIGGGPIGMEMAQAHRRLGSAVTVIEQGRALARDDEEAAKVVIDSLTREGVTILEGVKVTGVSQDGSDIAVEIEQDGARRVVSGSHLLVAAGRKAVVDGLDLEKAGIANTPKGITVDARLRTSNKRVFAIGDVAGGPQFTHVASHHASVAVQNIVLRLPATVDYTALPWVTYTSPELAQAGLTEADARARHGDRIRVVRAGFDDNDRARAERRSEGFVKAVALPNGRVIGATIVGHNAGELIYPWLLIISQKMKLSAAARLIAPYPTRGEALKRAAGSFYEAALFGPAMRAYVRLARLLP